MYTVCIAYVNAVDVKRRNYRYLSLKSMAVMLYVGTRKKMETHKN